MALDLSLIMSLIKGRDRSPNRSRIWKLTTAVFNVRSIQTQTHHAIAETKPATQVAEIKHGAQGPFWNFRIPAVHLAKSTILTRGAPTLQGDSVLQSVHQQKVRVDHSELGAGEVAHGYSRTNVT